MQNKTTHGFLLLVLCSHCAVATRGDQAEPTYGVCAPTGPGEVQGGGRAAETRSPQVPGRTVGEAIWELRWESSTPSPESACPARLDLGSPATSAIVPRPAGNESRAREGWFDRVARTQSMQPRWITPLVTVTPRLEEEVRYDFAHQTLPGGGTITSYGGGKGLELIPTQRIELIVGVPAYLEHEPVNGRNGFGDLPFLVKYRVLSAPEPEGNYILTLFFGATAPTASNGNGSGHAVFTPTVAFGKGWRGFDVQTNLAVGIPAGGRQVLGTPVVNNVAFQYRLFKKLWPELEVNTTWWPNGVRAGKKQVFLTPGIVVGRLSLWRRLGLTMGAGVQIAVTDYRMYKHSGILSLRFPF